MKQILFILAILLLTSSKGLGNEIPVPRPVLQSFEKKFSSAQAVAWSVQNKLFRVKFVLHDQVYFAFYDQRGFLVGVGKHISPTQLPLLMQLSLKQRFQNGWLNSLMQLEEKGGVSYYAVIENAEAKYYYKSRLGGFWKYYMKRMK